MPVEGGTLAWVAPFAAFVGFMAIEKALPTAPGALYPVRAALALVAIAVFSRRVISWVPNQALASIGMGVAVFFLWIGPDLLWPGMRSHWLFHNSLVGSAASTLPQGLKMSPAFIAVRVFGSVGLVPILEEVAGWQPPEIQEFFEGNGFLVREWARARTDWLTLRSAKSERADAAAI